MLLQLCAAGAPLCRRRRLGSAIGLRPAALPASANQRNSKSCVVWPTAPGQEYALKKPETFVTSLVSKFLMILQPRLK